MHQENSGTTDTFIAVRKAPLPARYPVGHQGHHLPNDIEMEFESGVLTISRTNAEKLLYELRQLLR